MRGSQHTYIYFIQAKDGGPVKIGWTIDPERRLKVLQSASPHKLVLRKVVRGSQRLEHFLHEHYAAYRLEGEWFEPQSDMPGCLHDGGISTATWLDNRGQLVSFEEEAREARAARHAAEHRIVVTPPSRRVKTLEQILIELGED
jgi:hypothetical protein